MRRIAVLLVAAVAGKAIEPGEKSGPVELLTPEGQALTMNNHGERRATVVLFLSARDTATDATAEAINSMYTQYRRRGVLFVGVFPNPAESGKEVRAYCQARGFIFPPYRDPIGKVVKQFGARVTPEAFVLDATSAVIYRGTIGSRDEPGGLAAALADIISGQPVRTARTTARGTPLDQPGPPRSLEDTYSSIEFSSELIFERIPGYPAHHCSSIVEAPNGDLLVIWYGGSYESADDQVLFLSRRKKGARNWTPPEILIRSPGRPPGNAVIFVDGVGRIWVVWGRMEGSRPIPRGSGWDNCRLLYRISKDNGMTWSRDELFYHDTLGWLPRNLPITVAGGALLLPLSDGRNGHGVDLSFFLETRDNGTTWTRSSLISGGEQPTIIQRNDGTLLAYLRTRPFILASESPDGGKTWTPARPTSLKCPDSGISMRRLGNGHLLLAFNNTDAARSPLHIARSLDEGRTWSVPLQLESNPGEYSYPSVYQTSDGKIHIIYTFRRYSIKHVQMNEEWLTHLTRPN